METNGALSDSHENGCLECSNNSNKESSIEKEVFVNHGGHLLRIQVILKHLLKLLSHGYP
uniref:Uncharacterized protein n=1 Tax=Rhizophora mucronata TaxID=61149 RepID=A0A2P2JTW8_RHIMU